MNGEDFLVVFDSIVATVLFWLLIGVLALYFGRSPAQRAIRSTIRIVHQAIRLAAAATQRTHDRLEARNREVLLAAGREAKERIIEREFERIGATVDRDLARYPEVQRLVSESIQKIDEDLQRTAEVPPEVPGWTRAVEAVAKVPGKADSTLRDVLEAIHEAVEDAHERSLSEYRKASRKRHRVLSRMMPEWRRIQRSQPWRRRRLLYFHSSGRLWRQAGDPGYGDQSCRICWSSMMSRRSCTRFAGVSAIPTSR